jgi:hypothetical protein
MPYIDIVEDITGRDVAALIHGNWNFLKRLKEQSPGLQVLPSKLEQIVINLQSKTVQKDTGIMSIVYGGVNLVTKVVPERSDTTDFVTSDQPLTITACCTTSCIRSSLQWQTTCQRTLRYTKPEKSLYLAVFRFIWSV